MRIGTCLLLGLSALSLSACSSFGGEGFGYGGYYLVKAKEVKVGNGSVAVRAPREWNKQSTRLFDDISTVEDWTQNGPYLDTVSFVVDTRQENAWSFSPRRAWSRWCSPPAPPPTAPRTSTWSPSRRRRAPSRRTASPS